MASALTSQYCSLPWATAIIRWQLPKQFGKRTNRKSAWIIPHALVEIENVHDEGLEFEPIHRVLFGLKKDLFTELKKTFGENFTYTEVENGEEMIQRVDNAEGEKQAIGLVGGAAGKLFGVIEIAHASSNLAVGTIQFFLDAFLKDGGAEKIDYDGDFGWRATQKNFFDGRGA